MLRKGSVLIRTCMETIRSIYQASLGIVPLLTLGCVHAEPVPVHYTEGVARGFVVMRTPQGEEVATGDLSQVVRGDRVSRRLVFYFKDGSTQDESVVFSQRGTFRLLSDRLIQKGPAFPHPMDLAIDGVSGRVKVRYAEDDGNEKLANERMALPADIANGLLLTLLRNLPRDVPSITVSLVAATPKPQLIKLEVSPEGEDTFSIGSLKLKATRYVIKVKLGGITGMVEPLVDKQPPDSHVWVVGGEAPSIVKAEAPLFPGGPVLRIELTNPSWP
jgi:hypothetical protein